ncbi:MAG: potassium transporter TrkG, partial [Gammaproteobacteria bacterium]
MRPSQFRQLTGLLLLLYSGSLVPVLAVSALDVHPRPLPWLGIALGAASVGALLWWPERHGSYRLRARDGFIVVTLFWLMLSLLSALPLGLLLHVGPADAVFEAVSGFTTTGATVLANLDHTPPSLLYYRHQLQWLGGIGMIVSAIAILPMIGVGGMQ